MHASPICRGGGQSSYSKKWFKCRKCTGILSNLLSMVVKYFQIDLSSENKVVDKVLRARCTKFPSHLIFFYLTIIAEVFVPYSLIKRCSPRRNNVLQKQLRPQLLDTSWSKKFISISQVCHMHEQSLSVPYTLANFLNYYGWW